MPHRLTRRGLVGATLANALTSRLSRLPNVAAQAAAPAFSYPVGLPGRVLGDGFLVRHGFATENTWYNPGWWHAGEDWYLAEGESGGAGVYAAAAGEVVFAGSDYPGRVVIVAHPEGLFSMYGHLDYAVAVETGQAVERGQTLGTILVRTDGLAPSHLHFEMRTFLTTTEVNGAAPRYGVSCGFECPPGPGYWPIDAPEHPAAMGWRNPTHVINRRAWPEGVPAGVEVVVSEVTSQSTSLWTAPADAADAEVLGELSPRAGDRYPLLAVEAGAEDTTGTSAEAYRVWYRIALPDGAEGWVRGATAVANDTGADGRPSSVQFDLLPAVETPTT
jgi:murein DD-endopeptidase MepM/ murein hydrolase activator NlpD